MTTQSSWAWAILPFDGNLKPLAIMQGVSWSQMYQAQSGKRELNSRGIACYIDILESLA